MIYPSHLVSSSTPFLTETVDSPCCGFSLLSDSGFSKTFLEKTLPLIPWLTDQWANYSEGIVDIFKTIQVGTRHLQILCAEIKASASANPNAVNHVPALKKALEVLLYEVKGLLAANKYESTFMYGSSLPPPFSSGSVCQAHFLHRAMTLPCLAFHNDPSGEVLPIQGEILCPPAREPSVSWTPIFFF